MTVVYLIGMFFCIVSTYNMISDFKKKQWIKGLCNLLILPWVAFFAISAALGGSAFNDAEHVFSGYQVGHYYLQSHSTFTEVSADVFHRIRALEIVGWVFFGADILSSVFLRNIHKS